MQRSTGTTHSLTCVFRDTFTRSFTFLMIAAALSPSIASAGTISEAERDSRLASAHELLGSRYEKSAVRSGENVDKVNQMIYRWTHESLPENYKKDYKKSLRQLSTKA